MLFDPSVARSRPACESLTVCPNARIGLGDIRSYDPAASLVVTLREGSHARFEPLEHRAPVRALRCTLRPTLTPHPAHARAPLSLSLACSAHPQAPGTAFLRERNSARIARDGA